MLNLIFTGIRDVGCMTACWGSVSALPYIVHVASLILEHIVIIVIVTGVVIMASQKYIPLKNTYSISTGHTM